jgi:ABC-type enterochelin transport system substrate-binding protein
MARKLSIPATLALAAAVAVLLGACKANDTTGNLNAGAAAMAPKSAAQQSGTTEVSADGARRVTVAELQRMLDGGEAVVYDTRARATYEQEHVKGALSMPFDEVSSRTAELPKDKTIVFYCT